MNRKILILLTLTLSIIIIPSYAYAFTDVEGHWAEKTINEASNMGFINGYEDGTFRPNDDMTRAELITIIDKYIGLISETDKYIPDVTSRDWYYSNLKKAIYFEIIEGNEQGLLTPNAKVTREEAIVIIARAFQINRDIGEFSSNFEDDESISSWARNAVVAFSRKQYVSGYTDNTIKPKQSVTRAEILTILGRVIKNILNTSYSSKITGTTLIRDKNVELHNVEIFGDLIIGEIAAKNNIKLVNTIINGNLVLYAPVPLEDFTVAVNGDIINAYENKMVSDSYYSNKDYGITFSIPNGATVLENMPETTSDILKNDLITVLIKQNDDYYTSTLEAICRDEIKNFGYDSIFTLKDKGEVQKFPYELFEDNAKTTLLIIKRDNIVYTIVFLNIVSENIVDSVISNVMFSSGTKVADNQNLIYKNSKLALKFNYRNGYVGVDDSYNTGVVYSGDSIFKLFIQVNLITDIDNYSIEEVKTLLKSLIRNDGDIIDEQIKKINNHPAIQFEIQSENDKIISLYVIIGHNLYNFIFKGETSAVDSIGKEMFQSIVNSMEF